MQKEKRRRRDTKQDKQKTEKIVIDEGSLIPALKEDAGYLAKVYNQRLQKQRKQLEEKMKKPLPQTRAGGVYIPPHKLRELQNQLMQNPSESQHQKLMWELLRKSINGIINKVNIANIQNVVIQLLNENILRGKGLLARSIIKAQMASPNFTHVYAALIAVINTKLPEIVHLIIRRVILQFQRSYARNNKIVCMATTKMLAHLINQKVLGDYAGLQLLLVMLQSPTEDSVQIACDFMIQAGQVLTQLTPAGANAIFQRFKNILHQGEIQQKVQYSIQNLFAIRKTGFKEHPGIIPELDLVQQEDQITHNFDLQQTIDGEEKLNIFREDPFYAKTEQQWEEIKKQILGEQNILRLKQIKYYQNQVEESEQQQQVINDLTEKDLINLRRTIYLTLQSTVDFEECAHKILKLGVSKGHEYELCDMIVECCMMQRIYQKFFGLLAQRFCEIDEVYKQNFIKCFVEHYQGIFKHETNKIRNLAKLFSHLFYTRAVDWKIFQIIQLTPETTTSASRTFLKILFREMAQNLGIDKLHEQFNNPQLKSYFQGLFPTDHPNNVRFAINYYTSIGLGKLSQELREVLEMQEKQVNMIAQQVEKIQAIKEQAPQAQVQQQQSSDSSSDSSSSSSDSSDETSKQQSSKQEAQNKKKEVDQKRHREKELEKSRSRQKERYGQKRGQRDRYRQKQRYGERQRYRERQRQRQKQQDKQRERERQRDKSKSKERERQKQKGNKIKQQSSEAQHSKSVDKKKKSKDRKDQDTRRDQRKYQKRGQDREQRNRDHRKYEREDKYEQKTHRRDYYQRDRSGDRYKQRGNKYRDRSESQHSQRKDRKKNKRRSES